MGSVDLEKYRTLFVDEATDHLASMARALAALETREGGDTAGSIDTLFRMAHSIKGMAASLDYEPLATLAHRLEDWLEPMREASVVPDGCLTLLYESVAALEGMVAAVSQSGSPAAREDLLTRLAEPADLSAPGPEPVAPKKKVRRSRRRHCRVRSACARRRSTGFSPQSVS